MHVYYNRPANTIYLFDDGAARLNGARWQGAVLQNSQCSIDASRTTATATGTVLMLNLSIEFTSSFKGPKNIYMWANDIGGTSSGVQARGIDGAIEGGEIHAV